MQIILSSGPRKPCLLSVMLIRHSGHITEPMQETNTLIVQILFKRLLNLLDVLVLSKKKTVC